MAGEDKRTSLINIDETQEGGAQPRRAPPGNDNEPYLIKIPFPLSPTFWSTYPSPFFPSLFFFSNILHPDLKVKIGEENGG